MKRVLLTAIDAALINLAVLCALWLRFDGRVPPNYLHTFLIVTPFHTTLVLLILHIWKVNRSLWRYAGIPTAISLLQALTLEHFVAFIANGVLTPHPFPRSVIILSWILSVGLFAGSRFFWKLYRGGILIPARRKGRRILIAGAGDIGAVVARELQRVEMGNGYPVGFADDDPHKKGRMIENLEVLGTTFDIPRLIREKQIDEVIVAAPSAPSRLMRQIFEYGLKAGIWVRTVPSLANFIEGKGALRQVREVSIEDLLGRDPVQIDQEGIESFLSNKRILVTGAGGSIGSELCRQIFRFRPSRLIALDHDENRLTYLGIELTAQDPTLDLLLVVGDIRDEKGMDALTEQHRPHVIFHAAAHKHVPLLEDRPREAIRNNIQGTLNVARAAQKYEAEAMVLISTDKAVDPTNVMGASKRGCELIIQALGQNSKTVLTAVRFGNVMGSQGSVIPIFRRQLAKGGPLTVTHPLARRYFMTVPEAAQLVLQAASFGRSGDIFILDMGEQVRILDVARQLIQLSGLEPDVDIPIVFTGLRPGEKLEEELLTDGERVRTTRHAKVFRCNLESTDPQKTLARVQDLIAKAEKMSTVELKGLLNQLVPEYQPNAVLAPLPDKEPEKRGESEPGASPQDSDLKPSLSGIRNDQAPPWSDRILAGLGLMTLGPPLIIMLSMRRLLGPEDVLLIREVRVGADRRGEERRRPTGWAPIDRRYQDRRHRNLGGRPYSAFRIRFRPGHGPRWIRPLDRWMRSVKAGALPGLLNVLRGHATLADLYPGRPMPHDIEIHDYKGNGDGDPAEHSSHGPAIPESQRRRLT